MGEYNPRVQAILFDLDNTLCTFVDAKRAACNAVIDLAGAGSAEELFSYFLRPVYNFEDLAHITDYLKDTGIYTEKLDREAGNVYEEVKLDTISLYPGVEKTLDTLIEAGVKMAVVTDASSAQAERRMHKLKIDSRIPLLVTPDRSGERKPGHASFHMAMRLLGVTSSETWVVGDSLRREIAPGLQLGLTTVFAQYGDWLKLEMPEVTPHHILNQFSDLMSLPGLDNLKK